MSSICRYYVFLVIFYSCKNEICCYAMKIVRGWVKHIYGCKPTEDETKNQVMLMGTVKYFGTFADLV